MNIRQITLLILSIGSFSAVLQADLTAQWGFSDRQGRRPTMEDAYVVRKIQLAPFTKPVEYFGIFDGHGGPLAAEYAAKYAPTFFAFSYKDKSATSDNVDEIVKSSFTESYDQLDSGMRTLYDHDGTTAISALLYDSMLYVAWAGDARAVVADKEGAIKLATDDHKPTNKKEFQRLKKAQSSLIRYGAILRVGNRFHSMAISRALGDGIFKQQFPNSVIAMPEMKSIQVQKGAMVILACDGVWDVLSNKEAVDFVVEHLALNVDELAQKFSLQRIEGEITVEDCPQTTELEVPADICSTNKLTLIARGLRDLAFDRGSTDNISVMVLRVE